MTASNDKGFPCVPVCLLTNLLILLNVSSGAAGCRCRLGRPPPPWLVALSTKATVVEGGDFSALLYSESGPLARPVTALLICGI